MLLKFSADGCVQKKFALFQDTDTTYNTDRHSVVILWCIHVLLMSRQKDWLAKVFQVVEK